MQKLLALIALASGIFAAFVDTRPKWDDTGILAGSIFMVCFLLALASPQRPWLWALLVGIWVPLAEIWLHQSLVPLVALAFAFAGAYAGWGLRKVLRLALQS